MSQRWLTTLSIAGLLLLLAAVVPYRSSTVWIDPVSGSTKGRTCVYFIPASTTVKRSSLEKWIIQREGGHASSWQFLPETSRSWATKSHACGLAPEIYPLHSGTLNDAFVRAATDAELAEFVRIMRTGTASEKRKAVEAACEASLVASARSD